MSEGQEGGCVKQSRLLQKALIKYFAKEIFSSSFIIRITRITGSDYLFPGGHHGCLE
jgi:hypothetical protein